MESRYRAAAVNETSLTDEEHDLMDRYKLDLEQIGYRRRIRAEFSGLARQEYAEDEENCFRVSPTTSSNALSRLRACGTLLRTSATV